jgi:hypothetical protein
MFDYLSNYWYNTPTQIYFVTQEEIQKKKKKLKHIPKNHLK